jgi:uncharacterized damage-inducible protein DinB
VATERAEPALDAGERDMLTGWLDYHRATLVWKCEGLTDDQLRQRSVPPSALTLLGLVRHMALNERSWFRERLAGEDLPWVYGSPDSNPDADFDDVDTADVAEDFATFERECEAARQAVAAVPDLDVLSKKPARTGEHFSARWILTHMIEEYARHNGHADLLRERIDGATGY